MGKRGNKKPFDGKYEAQFKSRKRKSSNVENVQNSKVLKFDAQESNVNDNCHIDSSDAVPNKVDLVTDKPLKRLKSGSVKKKKTVSQRSCATEHPIDSKCILKPWPTRNFEPMICDRELISSHKSHRKRGRKIKNESALQHRCFDFATKSRLQPCCLVAKIGSWNSGDAGGRAVHGSKSKSTRAQTTTSNSNSNSKTSDLPGFYFDPEKRCYFRIVPSATNAMSNAMTQERVAFEKREQLRQKDLLSLESSGKPVNLRHRPTVGKVPNIVTTFERSRIANAAPESRLFEMRHACIAKMGAHVGTKVERLCSAKLKRICLKSDQKKLLVSYETNRKSCLAVLQVKNPESDRSNPFGNIVFKDLLFSSSKDKVVDFGFRTFRRTSTLVCCVESGELHMFNEKVLFMRWGRQITDLPLCCSSRFAYSAFGTEKAVYVSEPLTMCSYLELKKINTSGVAVHSVTFANSSSNLLFCGARNQRILLYDQLSSRTRPVAYLTQQDGFSGDLYATKDDRYLLSSDQDSSRIQKWDIRQGRVVVDYPEHVNDYRRTMLIVDDKDEFLSAVGTDGYTRIWDLRFGELLKVIPAPMPTTSKRLPSVCFTDFSSKYESVFPGLLMGISDEFHFFSF